MDNHTQLGEQEHGCIHVRRKKVYSLSYSRMVLRDVYPIICYQLNNPPWLTKNLTNITTDDVPIELVELHVQ